MDWTLLSFARLPRVSLCSAFFFSAPDVVVVVFFGEGLVCLLACLLACVRGDDDDDGTWVERKIVLEPIFFCFPSFSQSDVFFLSSYWGFHALHHSCVFAAPYSRASLVRLSATRPSHGELGGTDWRALF